MNNITSKTKPFAIPYSVTKFPPLFQENFEKEYYQIWEEIQTELKEACRPGAPDYDKFMALLPKLDIFRTLYNPSIEQLEMLVTVLLRLLLEEKTTNANKLVIMGQIDQLMGDKTFKNLKLNWRAVYNFLDDIVYNPEYPFEYASGTGEIIQGFPYFISKFRILYPEEAITEVLTLLRQNLKPFFSSLSKGIGFLTIFFNTKMKFSKQSYDKWIPELFEFWSWKDSEYWDKPFLFIFSKLARNNPEIDWSPYYKQIFTIIFKLVTNAFPKKTISHVENNIELAQKYYILYPSADHDECIAELLVEMIRPKTFDYAPAYWEHFDRIYREAIPFIHPENPGGWTIALSSLYNQFCKFYTQRSLREQKIFKRINKLQEKKAAKIDKTQADQGGDSIDEDDTFSDEDEVDQVQQQQTSLEDELQKSALFLDDSCHEKFIEIMSFIIKNLLYSNENSVTSFAGTICRRLIMFRGDIFGPMIFDIMYSSFERSDLSYFGFIKVLALNTYPLLSRDIYKSGLYQLPKILDITLNHLTSYDFTKTDTLLNFYEAIFRMVPIYHPDDLRKNYENHFGRKDDKAIKEALNKDEDADLWELAEDLSDWAVRYFRRLLEIIPLLENSQNGPNTGIQTLLFIAETQYSFICQSSPRLLDKYVDILCHYLEENIQKYTNSYITNMIYSLSLAAPGLVAKKMIPFLKNKLIIKLSTPKSEEYSKKPLYHLIQQSRVSTKFDHYELSIENKDSLLSALSLIEDLIAYSSPAILDYTEDLELIIYHSLLHDEHIVFSTAAGVLQSLLLSLVSVYPINLGSQNPNDLSREEFLNFYKKIGKTSKKELEIIWHQPNTKEIEYTMKLFNLLFKSNLTWLSNKYLSNIESKSLNYETVSSLIDDMLLKGSETSKERKEIGRSLLLAEKSFLGISQRASFGQIIRLDSLKADFEARFCFAELSNVREETYQFLCKFILFACSSSCINDPIISRSLIRLLGTVFGYGGQISWIGTTSQQLAVYREFFHVNNSDQQYDNRYFQCMSVALELQRKIFGYQTHHDFSEKIFDLSLILWVFSFHSNEQACDIAQQMLYDNLRCLKSSIKDKVMTQLTTFTERFIRERFTFLKQNAKELEDKGVIKFNHNQLVKTNKDTYINLLINGAYRNLAYLYPFMSRHLELIYPFIETLLDNPRPDDVTFEIVIFAIFRSIDLTPHEIPLNKNFGKRNTRKSEPAILKSHQSYKKFEKEEQELLESQQTKYYDVSHFLEATKNQMEKCISMLEKEDVHWSHRLITGFLSMIIERYIDPTSSLYMKFVQTIFKLSSSDHYYLRYFSAAIFHMLMKRLPKKTPKEVFLHKKPEDFQGLKAGSDQVLKHRFLLKSDYENHYIKDSYTGFFDTYERLEIRQISNGIAVEIPKEMKDAVLQKEFFDKLFATMITDIPTKEEAHAASQSGHDYKVIIKACFQKTDKLKELIPSLKAIPSVNLSFMSSLFKHFGGVQVFNISFDALKPIAQDYNCPQKQVIAIRYFYAIMKNFIHWDKEYLDDILSKTADLFIHAIDNASLEYYGLWMQIFEHTLFRTDYRLMKPLLDKILNCCLDKTSSNIQARYLQVCAFIVRCYGQFAEEIALKLQDLLFEFKPTNINQVNEYCRSMEILLQHHIMLPINYQKLKNEKVGEDIDSIIQQNPDKYYLENDYTLYCINEKFIQTVDKLIEKTKEETCPNQKKNYLQVFFELLSVLYFEKGSYALFIHFENLLAFFIELNVSELGPEIIQTHTNYIFALSKISYPTKAIPKILTLIQNCLKNQSYHARENALKFYQYFHFNHIYYLKDKSIVIKDSLLDENPAVRDLAFDITIDLFKIYTKDELQKEINHLKQLVSETIKVPAKADQLSKGLYMIMAILLSYPYEIEEWTEELLVILLQTKKPKIVNEKFTKDFVVRFKAQHEGFANVNQRTLSYEVFSDLREIYNPNSYFV